MCDDIVDLKRNIQAEEFLDRRNIMADRIRCFSSHFQGAMIDNSPVLGGIMVRLITSRCSFTLLPQPVLL